MKSYLIVALAMFFGAIALKVIFDEGARQKQYTTQVKAHQVMLLGGLVREYKGQGGTIPNGTTALDSIPLPSWFDRSSVSDVVLHKQGGQEFIVASGLEPGEAMRIRGEAHKSVQTWVGVASGGTLQRLGEKGPPPPLPPSIPEGALVLPLTM